jgi:hypothetical protein
MTNESESMTFNGDLNNDSVPRPIGMLQNEGLMVPGQGYWVFMSKEGTYNPSASDGTADSIPIDNSLTDNSAVDNGNTYNGTKDVGTADSIPIDNSLTDNSAVGTV